MTQHWTRWMRGANWTQDRQALDSRQYLANKGASYKEEKT
ncbi:hypothetical protein MY1884_002903 [Beauveria asiatica]